MYWLLGTELVACQIDDYAFAVVFTHVIGSLLAEDKEGGGSVRQGATELVDGSASAILAPFL